jgi:allantoinase
MAHAGLRSQRVVLPGGVGPATLLFHDGRIARVIETAPELPGVMDAGDWVVSPGLVDCHVHINEPGRTDWEGFETATRAAAAGGVTTLVDMPLNSTPVTTTAAALAAKLESCDRKCTVDVGFWGGVIPGNLQDLPDLARAGVLGCKAFLVDSGIDDFPKTTQADLVRAMPVLRDLGLPLLAHAELDLGARVSVPDPRDYRAYLQSRPAAWEEGAIRLLIDLCKRTGCAVHIVHLSSASAVPMLRDARAEGLPITVETCPHYLCLAAEDIPDGATAYKCAPPIRERENREALWQALEDGVIDFVITDHSPCRPELKLPERGDFHGAWGGIASLQLGLPAIWTEARRRGAGLLDISRWMSRAPARFAGLADRKGQIAEGFDADLVVWDPDQAFSVDAERLFFRHRVSPYLGAELTGQVRMTLLRGEVVYDGNGHPASPRGRVLLHRRAA